MHPLPASATAGGGSSEGRRLDKDPPAEKGQRWRKLPRAKTVGANMGQVRNAPTAQQVQRSGLRSSKSFRAVSKSHLLDRIGSSVDLVREHRSTDKEAKPKGVAHLFAKHPHPRVMSEAWKAKTGAVLNAATATDIDSEQNQAPIPKAVQDRKNGQHSLSPLSAVPQGPSSKKSDVVDLKPQITTPTVKARVAPVKTNFVQSHQTLDATLQNPAAGSAAREKISRTGSDNAEWRKPINLFKEVQNNQASLPSNTQKYVDDGTDSGSQTASEDSSAYSIDSEESDESESSAIEGSKTDRFLRPGQALSLMAELRKIQRDAEMSRFALITSTSASQSSSSRPKCENRIGERTRDRKWTEPSTNSDTIVADRLEDGKQREANGPFAESSFQMDSGTNQNHSWDNPSSISADSERSKENKSRSSSHSKNFPQDTQETSGSTAKSYKAFQEHTTVRAMDTTLMERPNRWRNSPEMVASIQSDGTYQCVSCRSPLYSSKTALFCYDWLSFETPWADAVDTVVKPGKHGVPIALLHCRMCSSFVGRRMNPTEKSATRCDCVNSRALHFVRASTNRKERSAPTGWLRNTLKRRPRRGYTLTDLNLNRAPAAKSPSRIPAWL